ncbi:MAG: hypothetical protein GY754_24130 [bacterium]|nr:hypothetical protein [bacterium]
MNKGLNVHDTTETMSGVGSSILERPSMPENALPMQNKRAFYSPTQNNNKSYLFLFSADNKEKLKRYAGGMICFLETKFFAQMDEPAEQVLTNLSYIFQTGCDAKDERLALIVSNANELFEKLTAYCEGKTAIKNLYTNNVASNGLYTQLLVAGQSGTEFINSIFRRGECDKLALLWTSGVEIDWHKLYTENDFSEIKSSKNSLPENPFDKKTEKVIPKMSTAREATEEKPEPAVSNRAEPMSNDIVRDLQKIYAEIFATDVDEIVIDESFFDMGGTSMDAVQLINEIETLYVTITIEELFMYPSVALMAEYIADRSGIITITTQETKQEEEKQKEESHADNNLDRELTNNTTSDTVPELQEIFAEIFAMDAHEIVIDESFFDMGGTSMDAVQLINEIETQYIPFTIEDLFQYPSVALMAEYLDVQLSHTTVTNTEPGFVSGKDIWITNNLPAAHEKLTSHLSY